MRNLVCIVLCEKQRCSTRTQVPKLIPVPEYPLCYPCPCFNMAWYPYSYPFHCTCTRTRVPIVVPVPVFQHGLVPVLVPISLYPYPYPSIHCGTCTRDVVKYVFVFVFANTQKLIFVFVFVSENFKRCIFVFVFEPCICCICIKYSQIQYTDMMKIANSISRMFLFILLLYR